ncbi:ribosome maturation factor RimP [Coxiella endosymbiont of Amblyomma nuttalli]|uniref:ribosome maturation factor RimP n=1 Tax=Coxiella endosymbiont of Amblyomma nuttalli TaxID=2749996 RepID=UPI001FD25131|nr:ribosome maturation factor RimP [Coxiella endosymbiont of Amblyomma nuttalli]
MGQTQVLKRIVAPIIKMLRFELVTCELHHRGGMSTLRITIDGPDGISLDDCAKISRQVGAALDVANPINGPYNLEVSSPGLDFDYD